MDTMWNANGMTSWHGASDLTFAYHGYQLGDMLPSLIVFQRPFSGHVTRTCSYQSEEGTFDVWDLLLLTFLSDRTARNASRTHRKPLLGTTAGPKPLLVTTGV